MAIDVRKFVVIAFLSLVVVTVINMLLSNVFAFPVLKTGSAIILLLVSVFITIAIYSARDKSVSGLDVFYLLLVTGALVGTGFVLKNFLPEIFSALPEQTKNFYSILIN